MWQTHATPAEDPLRQGDLLSDVGIPDLALPLSVTTEGLLQGNAVARVKSVTVMVVSQCCSTKTSYAAVAPVLRRGGLTGPQELALLTEEPPPPDEDGRVHNYTYDLFRLASVGDTLAELDIGTQWVVDFGRIVSFTGACDVLRERRRARLTPEARRLLRIKLALFWARPEQEDVVALAELGFPSGLRPLPPI